MTMLKAIWQDLIEKKLWLIALPLVALIVAVPFALGRPGDAAPAPLPAPVAGQAPTGPELALTATETTGFERAARVNKKALDPFGRRSDKGLEQAAEELGQAADEVIDGGSGAGGGGGGGDTGGGTTGGGTTGGGDTGGGSTGGGDSGGDEVEYENDDLLSFLYEEGDAAPLAVEDARTLSPLPDAEDPFLVYVGKTKSGKASFLVSADVRVGGQGVCTPSKADCRTLELAVGETATFELLTKKNEAGANITARLTVTDIERKKVPVDGEVVEGDAGATPVFGARTRVLGARALKSVLDDEAVVRALKRQQIKIRS